jgi:hypothetical protein
MSAFLRNYFFVLVDLPDSTHVSGSSSQCFMLVFTTVTLHIKHPILAIKYSPHHFDNWLLNYTAKSGVCKPEAYDRPSQKTK